ncbi:DUF6264 family protein [Microbacterium sp. X-17]|uniref:DUF6264 family protein n=1 Tax=Microbacterium sp. X-17 TaxID=3144404 RepID=UPI0031F57ACC
MRTPSPGRRGGTATARRGRVRSRGASLRWPARAPYPGGVTYDRTHDRDRPEEPERRRGPEPVRERRNPWDLAATLVLMLVLAVLGMTASYAGMIAGTTASTCTGDCSGPGITVGLVLVTFGPIVVFFAGLFLVIRGVLRRAFTFWIPLVGFIALAILWYAGVALASGVL